MLDVGLLLRTQDLHHRVDRNDDLVEVASCFDLRSELCEAEVVEAAGQAGQLLVDVPTLVGRAMVSKRRELDKRCRGIGERLHGIRAGQDLDGLVHSLQLHGAQTSALGPLAGLDLASCLSLIEELLIGLQLCLRGIHQLLALCQGLRLLGLVKLLLLQGGLQRLQLSQLCGHEFLEGLLRISLLGVSLLGVTDKGVVHALQDALDLRGLRRIVAEGIVADLRCAQCRSPTRREVIRALDKVLHHLHVSFRNAARRRRLLEDAAHACDDAKQLCLPHAGLQKLAGAGSAQGLDCGLQRTDALLVFRLLAIVLLKRAVTDSLRLALRLDVLGDVLVELLDLSTMGGDLSLQLDDQGLQLLDLRLGLTDVLGFASHRRLAPARVLVV
mmetsp:Transcript_132656/g.424548  ORF Transcript_132656/g.424548 Transcript_132656/m.424548 type:complete len:385 (-) Transcript_132656:204-1358(-)